MTQHRLRQLWYVPLLGLSMLLVLVRLLVMARLLDTHSFGQFSVGLLVSSTFCMLACLGLQAMLYRDLPVLMVRLRVRTGAVLLAQCNVVALACAGAGVLAALAGVSVAGLSLGLLLVSLLHGLSQQVFMLATAESRSRGEPIRFAQQSLTRALGILIVGAAVAYLTASPTWILLAEAVTSLALAQSALGAFFRGAGVSAAVVYQLAVRRLPKLQWRAAFALFAVGMVGFMLLNVDRWIAAQWLPADRFAQYAFAWTALMVAQSAQLLVNASVFPLLARRYGKFGLGSAYRVCAWVSCALLLGGALLGLPAWALLDAAISRWFPDYAAALELLPLFIMVAVLRISDYWSSFMIIVGREARLLALNLVAGFSALVIWLLWTQPWGQSVTLWQIGLLPALLTAVNYLVTSAAAWQATRS